MQKQGLTSKQEQILKIIKESILEKGYPPSVREMCTAVGLSSTSSVHAHLEALAKKGYIKKDPSKPRTIEIMDDTFNLSRREVVNLPLLGDVAAGEPIFATENITNYFPMPVDILPNNETFMLNVKGDSMINAGIFNGDKIIVSKQATAENGEIVVAMVEDSATVKRFYKEKGYFRLHPENDALDDIIVKDLEIIGKVVGLLRMM
jgi:repressor lexA